MGYATVRDFRREGIMERAWRLRTLIDEASAYIDRVTGWFFEPRDLVLSVEGRGTPSIEPQVPPIWIDELSADGAPVSLDEVHVVGAPVGPGFSAPVITRRAGTFPKGHGSVVIDGVFGFTEPDGTDNGRTPLAIRRACMLLTLRWLDPLGSVEAEESRMRTRLIEERTRDQSYKLSPLARGATSEVTGDPEIDAILVRYTRPAPMGAA